MSTRIITSIIGLPLLAVIVAYGGIPLQITCFVLAVTGMTEMYKAMSNKRLSVHYVGYIFAAIYFFFLRSLNSDFMLTIITLFIITDLVCLVLFHSKINIIDCAISFFGFFYVAFLLSFVYLVRLHHYGAYFVWLIFICSFGCDTFAYFTGIALGRHKLTPTLSPKKTIEGAVGGVVGATLLAYIFGLVVAKLLHVNDPEHLLIRCTIVGVFGAVFAILGDLSASAIKRYTKIKDFGRLIPGHGGVLDRFDSVFFTAPVVYIVMIVLMGRG